MDTLLNIFKITNTQEKVLHSQHLSNSTHILLFKEPISSEFVAGVFTLPPPHLRTCRYGNCPPSFPGVSTLITVGEQSVFKP